MIPHSPKTVGEVITLSFDFTNQVVYGDTLSAPVCTVVVRTGIDSVPSEMILGSATLTAATRVVTQRVQLGNPGVIYEILCTISGLTCTYTLMQTIAVLSDEGSFGPGRGLYITGDLPDTYAYIDYFELLQIHEGYEPFMSISVYSGNYPIGWTPTVVAHDIVTSGIANDTGTFTFVYKLVDFAGQIAYSSQVVYIPPVDLYGTIPATGYVGIAYTGHYDARWGMPPYAFDTSVGPVPPGLTLSQTDADTCTYAGIPTTRGTYPIVTRVIDDIDEFDIEPATITIMGPQFLACGSNASVYMSYDALVWSSYGTGSVNTEESIAFGVSMFVVIESPNNIRSSPDLITWTPRTSGIATTSLSSCIFGGTLLIAAGHNNISQDNFITTSPDGITWTSQTVPVAATKGAIKDSAYGNGIYIIVGNCDSLRSVDGITWTRIVGHNQFFGVNYGNGLFMAVGNGGRVQTSPDGITWTAQPSIGGVSFSLFRCAYGQNGWIATANGGTTYNGIYISTDDGANWTRTGMQGSDMLACAYIAGTYVAATVGGGGGSSAISTNGTTWTSGSIPGVNTIFDYYTSYI